MYHKNQESGENASVVQIFWNNAKKKVKLNRSQNSDNGTDFSSCQVLGINISNETFVRGIELSNLKEKIELFFNNCHISGVMPNIQSFKGCSNKICSWKF